MGSSHGIGVLVGAGISTVLTLSWLLLAVSELKNGWSDTLRHWWSTLPAVAVVVSVFVLILAWRQRRDSSPVG